MVTTAFISMLLSNTATAAMMVQIVKVILTEIEKTDTVTITGTPNPALHGTYNEGQEVNGEIAFDTLSTNADAIVEEPDEPSSQSEEQKLV